VVCVDCGTPSYDDFAMLLLFRTRTLSIQMIASGAYAMG
jgi:hypothetical protein